MKILYQIFCPKQWGTIKNIECRRFAEKYFDYLIIIAASYLLSFVVNFAIRFDTPDPNKTEALYIYIAFIPVAIALIICVRLSNNNHKRILRKAEPLDGLDDESKSVIRKFRVVVLFNIVGLVLISVIVFYI